MAKNPVLAIFGQNLAILAKKSRFWHFGSNVAILAQKCPFGPFSPKRFIRFAQFSLWKLQLLSITRITYDTVQAMTVIWVSFVFFYLTSNIVQYPEKYYRYSNSECRNGFMVSRNMYHLYYFDLILYFLPRKRWKVPDLYKTIFYKGNIRENMGKLAFLEKQDASLRSLGMEGLEGFQEIGK